MAEQSLEDLIYGDAANMAVNFCKIFVRQKEDGKVESVVVNRPDLALAVDEELAPDAVRRIECFPDHGGAPAVTLERLYHERVEFLPEEERSEQERRNKLFAGGFRWEVIYGPF